MTEKNTRQPTFDQRGQQVGTQVNVAGDYHAGSDALPLFLNVPPLPAHFLGRDALLTDLVDRLVAGHTTVLSADGLPGVGKTSLAIALCRHPRILDHFADGVLWAGLGRHADVASIQATWSDALGADLTGVPDPAARRQRIDNAIGQRRLLIVLDDAWQSEPLRWLRCTGPHVAHILTTRNQEIARSFAGASNSVSVPVLDPLPGRALLARLAPEAYAGGPAAVDALADKADGLPLALELLGGYLAGSRQRRTEARRQHALASLADPAARLALATQRLGDAAGAAFTLRQTIALSLEELPASTLAAFHALGAFAPKPARFDLPAALAVTQASEDDLLDLADRSLLEMGINPSSAEYLALHQTLADFARPHTPAEAITRHRHHYLTIVDEDQHDWQRIEDIYPQILHAWRQLAEDSAESVDFVDSLRRFQSLRGLWQDRLAWLGLALRSAQQAEDVSSEARMLNSIGYAYSALGEKQQALVHYNQALRLFHQEGDKVGEARTRNNIGVVYDGLGEKQQALSYYGQALLLRRQVGDKAGEATTLTNIGAVYDGLGEKQQALGYYERALPLFRQEEDKAGEAATLNNIGGVCSALGEKQRALGYFQKALLMHREAGNMAMEATTLNNVGLVHSALGEKQQALEYYEQALALSRRVEDKAGEAVTLNNIGLIYADLGQMRQALGCYAQALPLSRQVCDIVGEATALNNIGRVYDGLGEKQQALGYYEQALPLQRQVGDKVGEATTLNNIAVLSDYAGDVDRAISAFRQILPIFQQIGDALSEANVLFNLASVLYHRLRQTQEPAELLTRSIALLEMRGLRLDASNRSIDDHRRLLARIHGAAAPQLDADQTGLTLDQLLGVVAEACRGNTQHGQQLYIQFQQHADDPSLPDGSRALARVLVRILAGERNPDLSVLPAQLRAPVRSLLDRLAT